MTACRRPLRLPPSTARRRRAARGFILAYLLFALSLAGVVAVGLSQLRSRDVQSQRVAANVERLLSGIATLRGQVLLCAATWPAGATVAVAGSPGLSVGTEFPVFRVGGNLVTGTGNAADLHCPGIAPIEQSAMWTGRDGVFFPDAGSDFGAWQYSITTDGTPPVVRRIALTIANQSGAQGLAALRRVVLRSPGSTVSLDDSSGVLTVELLTASP